MENFPFKRFTQATLIIILCIAILMFQGANFTNNIANNRAAVDTVLSNRELNVAIKQSDDLRGNETQSIIEALYIKLDNLSRDFVKYQNETNTFIAGLTANFGEHSNYLQREYDFRNATCLFLKTQNITC